MSPGHCATCQHWTQRFIPSEPEHGVCIHVTFGFSSFDAPARVVWIRSAEPAELMTSPDFGCVAWTARQAATAPDAA